MRKPRDYESELRALDHKARQLKSRRQSQLGELVIASGADTLTLEELAGALIIAAGTSDLATKEAWRKRGAAFFSGNRDSAGRRTTNEPPSDGQTDSSAPPPHSGPGTA